MRYLRLSAANLLFLLGSAAGHAQSLDTVRGLQIQRLGTGVWPTRRVTLDGPRYKGPSCVIYVDGQRRDSTALVGLNPNDIATVSVLNPNGARQLGPDEARLGVLVVTTKAGQHTHAVRAFDKRLRKLTPPGPPAAPPAHDPQ